MSSRSTNATRAVRRFSVIAAMFCAVSLAVHGAQVQQIEAANKYILETKAKAEQGEAKAQFSLGNYYSFGAFGLERDYKEAVKWLRKSAEQGYGAAQNNLGLLYSDGHGVAKDNVEAIKWFRKSAEQHDVAGQNNLGYCYAEGRGVERNSVEAYAWHNLAAQNHLAGKRVEAPAKNPVDPVKARSKQAAFDQMLRNDEANAKTLADLEQKMSPEQVAAGKKRTEELRAQINAKLKSGGK